MKLLPIIGFDRYVPRHWLDLALAIAAGQREPTDLARLLASEITGIEARSKTMIIINRMWLAPHPSLVDYSARGVHLHSLHTNQDLLPLHWGMAVRSHPFFATLVDCIGRLLRLHGEFTSAQVTRRLKEQYGDRASILRASEAVLQTLQQWSAIRLIDPKARKFAQGVILDVSDTGRVLWLLEAALFATGKSMPVTKSANQLFPLRLRLPSEADVKRAGRLRLSVTGTGELVVSVPQVNSAQ